jgi:hypothetical protein
MSGDAEVRYWRARAESLERSLVELRARVLALPRVLPAEAVEFLEREPAAISGSAPLWSVFRGWEDTNVIIASDVETELGHVWERLGSVQNRD